uniref:ATP synthase complex subunit 8 n=1 Tax=Osteochilus schlegelii TaxID=643381 RepID=V5XV51_9TELE|nr:ATP synthase F0 subunit 8 [Osteochilus schlegelii]BAO08953.1 ATPase subunit 8 [Osteochilus schlegelii]
MPQLDPNPWFAILMFSWFTFLIIIPNKILNYTSPNEPALVSAEKHKTGSWDWTW